jgi:CRISPR-associated protein Cas2
MATTHYLTERLNAYRLMWVLVFFDLPTFSLEDKKRYTDFRKNLMEDGFSMFQFSIYARPCSSRERADVHLKRVESILPPRGKVGILTITDKQFGMMRTYFGSASVAKPEGFEQLMLF